MKTTVTLMATTALSITAGAVSAQDMADEMTIVSWGGAYSKSQKLAYHDPYSEKTGVTIINDDYIPILVDADKRPDVDQRYNRGGWPTTAFLTIIGYRWAINTSSMPAGS